MYKIMRTKFDIIRSLKGKKVLDIGGTGYSEDTRRDRILKEAWSQADRKVLDLAPGADYVCDLDAETLPRIPEHFDTAVAFDVLEHVKNPGRVLEWIPAGELWINLPNATSIFCQYVERKCHAIIPDFCHLYSFNMLTARNLVAHTGWRIEEAIYTYDWQSFAGRIASAIASLSPYFLSMGVAIHCFRSDQPAVRKR